MYKTSTIQDNAGNSMINAEQLVTEAMDQAGLDDFGGEAFREPLALLESCLNSQAGLNDAGGVSRRDGNS